MNNENLFEISTKKRFFPNLAEAWILVLCLMLLMFVAFALAKLLEAFKLDSGIISLVQYVVACGTLIFVALLYKKRVGDNSQICCKNRVSLWIYLFTIPAIIGLSGFVDIISTIILPEIPQDLQDALTNKMNVNAPVLLLVIVAAPVLEEIFCRGIICEGLIKNYSPRAAILWSAFIFAVIHLNPWQGLSAFVIGCFLGWIYYKTRSILPCIFIHFVNNSLAVCAYNYHEKSGYDINTPAAEAYGINEIMLLTIYFVVFSVSFFLLMRVMRKFCAFNE